MHSEEDIHSLRIIKKEGCGKRHLRYSFGVYCVCSFCVPEEWQWEYIGFFGM
jgi:hypothetical protein